MNSAQTTYAILSRTEMYIHPHINTPLLKHIPSISKQVYSFHAQVTVYKVKYETDDATEDVEEEELRLLIDQCNIASNPAHTLIIEGLRDAFAYLDVRLNGNCNACYSCEHLYEICRLIQTFDPAFALQNKVDNVWIDEMAAIKPLAHHNLLEGMKTKLSTYLVQAQGAHLNRAYVELYSSQLLGWWRQHATCLLNWVKAARVAFALSPNSALCERKFSLLEILSQRAAGACSNTYFQTHIWMPWRLLACDNDVTRMVGWYEGNTQLYKLYATTAACLSYAHE
eukprot:6212830-Pleurochrysis_carterae.AAC.1